MTRSLGAVRPPGSIVVLCLGLALAAFAAGAAGGAGYVGSETCAECHDDVAAAFELSAHGRVELAGWSSAEGCESCHGPGQAHAEEGEEMVAADANGSCVSCHNGPALAYWEGSTHETAGSDCGSCHEVHQPWTADRALINKSVTEGCLGCHKDLRKTLHQRSNHPLKHGQMSCDSCHNPHGSAIGGAVDALSVNDKCWECHAETRGPFLWEHAPVRENCLSCHNAHGSNQTKMLTVSAPRLCQSCHLFGHHQTVPGEPTQVWNVNRSCVNCHPRIHGSNHPSGVIFMR